MPPTLRTSPPRAPLARVTALALALAAAAACNPRELATDLGADGDAADPADADPDTAPLALVYRGSGACEGCAESLAALLERAGYATRYVGPDALTRDATFEGAALYAQPGGDETMLVRDAVGAARWPAVRERLRTFVADGGAYLGICLGGFMAGEWMDDDATIPALGLLDGDASYFTATPRQYTEDQVIAVDWLHPPGRRHVYFQEGPSFAAKGDVWARYSDRSAAALIASFGRGKVGVSGIHFEADQSWYDENELDDPDGPDLDLGEAFIRALR